MKSIKRILSLLLVLSLAVLSAGCAKSNDPEISEVVSETSQPEDISYNPSAVTEITLVPLFQLNVIEDANITETFTSSYETINDFLNLQLTEFLRVIAFYYMGESVDGFWMKPVFYNAGMADGSNRHDWYYDICYDIFDRNGSSYSLTIYLNARHENQTTLIFDEETSWVFELYSPESAEIYEMYMNDLIEITDGANSMGKILRIDEEKDEWEYYPPEEGIYSDNYAVDSANWAVDPSWPTTANDSWIRFVNDYGAGIVQDADYNWICLIGSQKLYWGEDSRWHYGDYYQFGDTDYFTDRMGGVSINDYTFFSSEIGNWMVAGYYGLSKCDPPQEAYDLMAQEQTFESDQRRDKDIKAFQNIYGFTCYEENGDWYVDTTQGILKYDPFNKEWSGTVSVADLNSEGIWIYTDEEIMVFCVELNHGEFRYADGRDDDGNIKIYGVSCSGLPGSQYAEFTGIYNAAPDWPLFSDIDHPDRW